MQFKPLLAFISLSQLLSLASAAPAAELEARQGFDDDTWRWLNLHNRVRSRQGVPSLRWSSSLARRAKQVAEQCTQTPQLWGEDGASFNLGMGSIEQAFDDWTDTSASWDSNNVDASLPWRRIIAPNAQLFGCAQAECEFGNFGNRRTRTMNACYYNPRLRDRTRIAGTIVRVSSLALLNLDLTTPFAIFQ
uniref:Pathogenesis-related protein 1 n=1 Tax=Moniliophthora perniciosa TaxID=153609 RepID=A0A8E6YAC2_MONPR|nr:pathogenesis-related protein 1 [Moniliophthora perniciosa]